MSAQALIADLTRRGVKLAVNADRLRWRAPKGTVGPQEVAAMRHHKVEIIHLLSRQKDGGQSDPKGDMPDAWRVWWRARIQRHKRLGRDGDLGGLLTWGEAENIWHRRHGMKPDPARRGGCNELLSGRARLDMGDDTLVHWDAAAGLDCLAAYGVRWRADATAGLVVLGIEPPRGQMLPDGEAP